MSFFSDLMAGGAEGLLKGIGDFAISIRTALTGEAPIDATKRAELLLQAQAIEAAQDKAILDYQESMAKGQMAINEVEAKNTSLFVSGWRPAAGWVCIGGMFYTFLAKPLLPWFVKVVCLIFSLTFAIPILPEVPMGDLMTLLFGMLGLGAMRSYEKIAEKKINKNGNGK